MLSLTVEDMGRAVEFYSEFLDERPVKQTERLSIFDLGNIKLCLWNASVDSVEVDFGENAVGTFHVEDLEEERERLENLGVEVEGISD